jgi:hypothetical protein
MRPATTLVIAILIGMIMLASVIQLFVLAR